MFERQLTLQMGSQMANALNLESTSALTNMHGRMYGMVVSSNSSMGSQELTSYTGFIA